MRSRCTHQRSRADSVNGPRFRRRAPLPLGEAALYLILRRDCGLNDVFNIAAAVPARRSSRTYSSSAVGESPHRGTAFYASNGPAKQVVSQLPCPPTCSTGGGVGGLAFAAKAPPPTSTFRVCGWITSYLIPSQASSTTSH